jgi:hypothetical protein
MKCTCGTNSASGPGGACSSWCDSLKNADKWEFNGNDVLDIGNLVIAKSIGIPILTPGTFGTFSSPISIPASSLKPISAPGPAGVGYPLTPNILSVPTVTTPPGQPIVYDVSGTCFIPGVTQFSHTVFQDAMQVIGNPAAGTIEIQFEPKRFAELLFLGEIDFNMTAPPAGGLGVVPSYKGIRCSACSKVAASMTGVVETRIYDLSQVSSSPYTPVIGKIITREY